MAPTSMPSMQNGKKNDRRDACSLAKNLDKSDYKEVYVPSIQDEAVKDYIRMRDNTMHALTQVKIKSSPSASGTDSNTRERPIGPSPILPG